jgi:hypothetical protein
MLHDPASIQSIRDPDGAICRPVNAAAFRYWNSIRDGRDMPARTDLDPLDIPQLLPSIILLDVLHEPRDFRYRLVGTRWVWHFDRDDTGRLMSDLPHQRAPSRVWDACCAVVAQRRPHLPADIPYVGKQPGYSAIEPLIMPLSRDGFNVNMLFVTVDFTDS